MNDSFNSKILRLAVPIAFQQFMLALASACDVLMLGGVNQDSLSAVSLASQVTFVFNLVMSALVTGENMFIAQYYGKLDYKGVRNSAGYVLKFVMLNCVFFFLITLFAPQFLMRLFTNDTVLITYGCRYLRIVGLSYIFSGMTQVIQGILKNCGHVGKCTMISTVIVIVNIILNATLIYGWFGLPAMEIAGVALATVIANGMGLALALWTLIFADNKVLLLTPDDIIKTNDNLKSRFWKHVLPVLLNELIWGCGFTMYSVILGHLGSDAVAANSIVNITKNLLICVCYGFGFGGSIIVGNMLGQGKTSEVKEIGNRLCKLSVISGIATGAVIICLIPLITRFTNLEPTAAGYLKWMLIMSSYYVAGKSVNCMVISGIFPAGGDTRFGAMCDAVTMWCFAVPLGCIVAFVLKLPVLAIYFFLNLDEVVKLPAVYIHYKKYKWIKNLTEMEN